MKAGAALKPNEIWKTYLQDIKIRWPERDALEPLPLTIEELKHALFVWEQLGILQRNQRLCVKEIKFQDLSSSDQDRLKAKFTPKHVSAWRVPREEPLKLHDGRQLSDGRLGIQVIFHNNDVIAMNIQIQGRNAQGETYMRIDLDPIQMAAQAGEEAISHVIHRFAHCHVGRTPDASEAETHDPRIPIACHDPLRALDYLLLQFFPHGHQSVNPPIRPQR